MPNTKSAEKALRQSKTRRVRNLAGKESFKDAIKDFKKLVAANKFDEATKLLSTVYKKLDKAAKTGIIKSNKADRLKSKTSKLIGKKK
jgi:small subunit ribosomal protein S20